MKTNVNPNLTGQKLTLSLCNAISTKFACLLLLSASLTTRAEVTLFTNRAEFASQAVGASVLDFAAANTNGTWITDYSTAAGLTLNGVNFVGRSAEHGYAMNVIGQGNPDDTLGLRAGWEGNPTVLNSSYEGPLDIMLPPQTVAVGFNFYTLAGGGHPQPYGPNLRVTLSTGDSFLVQTLAKPSLAFAGFIASGYISSLRIESVTGHQPQLSSFRYATEGAPQLSIHCSQMEMCWPSRTNKTYKLQYRSDLTGNAWTDLGGPIQGNGSTNCINDTVVVGQPQRYYQLLTLP